MISAAIAGRLPGPGAVYLEQKMRFCAPVRPGDTVHAIVTVKAIEADRGRVTLDTTCKVAGKAVIEGEAMVRVDSRLKRERRAGVAQADS